ncbi:MAG TPA: hypothetical protein PKA74_13960 [Bauldia sp.]|nr:hypothetical protein [Bauldia sp.]
MFNVVLATALVASIGVYLLLHGIGYSFEVTKIVAGATLLVPTAIAVGLFLPRERRPFVWGAVAVAALVLVTVV